MKRRDAVLIAVPSLLCAATSMTAVAEDTALRMTRSDCGRLVALQPGPDVAYQPGIDVRGRPVAPADTEGGGRLQLSDDVLIPLELRLADRLGAVRPSAEARVVIGTVELRGGRVYFNGQPIDDATAAELASKCRGKLNRGR